MAAIFKYILTILLHVLHLEFSRLRTLYSHIDVANFICTASLQRAINAIMFFPPITKVK